MLKKIKNFLSGLLITQEFRGLQEKFHQGGIGCLVVKQMLLKKIYHQRDLQMRM
uniref:Uncharacterized protein n=1 Tax=Wolbachia endosymbiont of Oeneis ivallda TaxID=3171168 RepID=A0AAU7YNN1_9RICK